VTGGLELFPERKDVVGESSSPEKPDNSLEAMTSLPVDTQQREGVDVVVRVSATRREVLDAVASRGFWTGRGKRAFDVAKRMQRDNAIAGATYSFSVDNANGMKSQWNHPKFIAAYEVVVDTRGAK
jgi:hypothetical protein